jgi:hypothetical protein
MRWSSPGLSAEALAKAGGRALPSPWPKAGSPPTIRMCTRDRNLLVEHDEHNTIIRDMPRLLFDHARVNRSALERTPLKAQGRDNAYWLAQSPRKRLEALELLRQLNYDYDPDTARFSRVHLPVKRAAS